VAVLSSGEGGELASFVGGDGIVSVGGEVFAGCVFQILLRPFPFGALRWYVCSSSSWAICVQFQHPPKYILYYYQCSPFKFCDLWFSILLWRRFVQFLCATRSRSRSRNTGFRVSKAWREEYLLWRELRLYWTAKIWWSGFFSNDQDYLCGDIPCPICHEVWVWRRN
jgi:hypothetical protein